MNGELETIKKALGDVKSNYEIYGFLRGSCLTCVELLATHSLSGDLSVRTLIEVCNLVYNAILVNQHVPGAKIPLATLKELARKVNCACSKLPESKAKLVKNNISPIEDDLNKTVP